MNTMPVLLTAIASFLIGSIPTAYLLVRRHRGTDIRQQGTGNVGAMNAYEVTRSRRIGIAIFILDFLKGAICVAASRWVFPSEYVYPAIALFFVVLGHNYSPWIGFKGGRGLSAATGGAVFLNPLYLLYWAGFWLVAYLIRRDIIIGNVAATVLSPVLLLFTPAIARAFMLVPVPGPLDPVLPGLAVYAIILLRHIEPIRTLLRDRAVES